MSKHQISLALGVVALGVILIGPGTYAAITYQTPASYSPTTSYSPTASYGYASPYGGYSYPGLCGSLKVTEVLDQIYCHHGYYTRFTSTDLAAIKVALYQLGLVTKFAHIQAVLDYVEQAIYILQDLKEETYKSYDTSELVKYNKKGGDEYDNLQPTLTNITNAMAGHEAIRQGYRKQIGMLNFGNYSANPYVTNYSSGQYKRMANVGKGRSSSTSKRRTRESETDYDYAGDYTCGFAPASYCASNSLVVKNVMHHMLEALKSLESALSILHDYIQAYDCGTNNDKKYALLVTTDSFGSIFCAASVLLEAAKYEYTMYTGMSGANSYSSSIYGRASGVSSMYPGLQGYHQVPYQTYNPYNQYRYQRAAVAPALATTPVRSGIVVVG